MNKYISKINFRCAIILAIGLIRISTVSAQYYSHHSVPHYYPHTSGASVGYHGYATPYVRAASLGYGYRRPYYAPYRYYNHYPSIGFRLSVLPFGYNSFFWGGYPYYYYNNVYYRRSADNYYEVVTPPLGAKLPQLPANAKAVVIDGKKYYECDEIFYEEELNARNQLLYTVVGTNGELNRPVQAPAYREPQVGDIVSQLPDGCKSVYLNGKKYFESPLNIYYQENVINGMSEYKIVGK